MLYSIAQKFATDIIEVSHLGEGLINDTFLVSTKNSNFILQKINAQVFPKPRQIMENLHQFNQHLATKKSLLQMPILLKTISEHDFFQDSNGNIWRALSFIENSESLQLLNDENIAAQVGFALGHFHVLVSDLNPELLHDTLPNFHIAPYYLQQYQQVLQQGTVLPEHADCRDFIAHHLYFVHDLENAKQQGLLKLRVTHGDPKLNNFLFDKQNKLVLSLIDLDTIKPALVHYDIADCLRSCCHIQANDEFDIDFCEIILSHYLKEAGVFFSAADYDYLYPAIRLLPFELGLRFYTDYLQGNCYFKVTETTQNLQRAMAQFNLCRSIINQEQTIQQIITRLSCQINAY